MDLTALALVALAAITMSFHHHRTPVLENRFASPVNGEPRTMPWAWETPEDLRRLDRSRAGVSFLARELALGQPVTVRPRLQPLWVPQGTWMAAVPL